MAKISDGLFWSLTTLKVLGYYPPDSMRHGFRITLYNIYSSFILGFFFFTYLASELIYMVTVFGDIENTVEASFLLITHIGQTAKTFEMLIHRKLFMSMVDRLDSPMFNQPVKGHQSIIKLVVNEMDMISKVFLGMGVATCAIWAVFPFIEFSDIRKLPMAGWFPFDTQKSPGFEIIYVYQMSAVLWGALTNISLDIIVSGLMCLAAEQLEILGYNIAHLWPENKDGKTPSSITYKEGLESKEKLKSFIAHHQEIITYVSEIQYFFRFGFTVQVCGSVIAICITAFQITVVPPLSLRFVSMILYQGCMLFEVFLYCYFGNQVQVKSTEIFEAINKSSWYIQDREFNRLLLIIMERCKRPLVVKAGNIFALSLSTFVTILKSSYTYFAMLKVLQDKK